VARKTAKDLVVVKNYVRGKYPQFGNKIGDASIARSLIEWGLANHPEWVVVLREAAAAQQANHDADDRKS
jgi:hypothetical protein